MGETCLRSTPFLFLSSSTEIAWGIRVPWRTWVACRLVATTTGVHLFKVDKVISHFSYLCFLISHVTELCVFWCVLLPILGLQGQPRCSEGYEISWVIVSRDDPELVGQKFGFSLRKGNHANGEKRFLAAPSIEEFNQWMTIFRFFSSPFRVELHKVRHPRFFLAPHRKLLNWRLPVLSWVLDSSKLLTPFCVD